MKCKTYTYKTCSDGTAIPADVYFSPAPCDTTDLPTPKPIALLIHGSGWTVGSRTDVPESQIELLLELGYVPVAVDYRLCPTIGLFDGPVTDVLDALSWCQTQLPDLLCHDSDTKESVTANGSKVVAVGWSAGGHLALMLSQAATPPVAILTFYPVTALSDPYWHVPAPSSVLSIIPTDLPPTHPGDLSNNHKTPTSFPLTLDFSNPRIVWTFNSLRIGTKTIACIGDGNLDRVDLRTWYADPNPTASGVGKAFPPVMVLHGDADDLAPVRLSVEMVECVRRQGGVAEMDILVGMGHGFDVVAQGQKLEHFWPCVRKGYDFLGCFIT